MQTSNAFWESKIEQIEFECSLQVRNDDMK